MYVCIYMVSMLSKGTTETAHYKYNNYLNYFALFFFATLEH